MRKLAVSFVATALAVATLMALPLAQADDELEGTFEWLFGADVDAFLQSIGFLPPTVAFGTVAAVTEDGDVIRMSGQGTFTLGDDEGITGGGVFVHLAPDGSVIASGSWTMVELEEFTDFGTIVFAGETLRGGILEAEILVAGVFEGELTIVCLVGSPPPGLIEGIMAEVGDFDFDTTVPPVPGPTGGGLTVFVG